MTSIRDKVSANYDPPEGISAPLARVSMLGGYDNRTFAVAILSLVQDGFIDMVETPDGGIELSRRKIAWLPNGAAQQWLLKGLVGKGDMVLGRETYTRLMFLRDGHARHLLKECGQWAGNGGLFIMAAIGLLVLLVIGLAAVMGRAPAGIPAFDALAPYWPIPLVVYGLLWAWRKSHMRSQKARLDGAAVELERYRRYILVAQKDRLDPKFAADGAYKFHDPDTVYAAAFGVPNAWADPLVHLLESLLPAGMGEGQVRTAALTQKRGFGPRQQPDGFARFGALFPCFGQDDIY